MWYEPQEPQVVLTWRTYQPERTEFPVIIFSYIAQAAAMGVGIAMSVLIWVELWNYSNWTWSTDIFGSTNQCYLVATSVNMCAVTFTCILMTFILSIGIVLAQRWRGFKFWFSGVEAGVAVFGMGMWFTVAAVLTVYGKRMENGGQAYPPQVNSTATYRLAVRMLSYVMAMAFLYQVSLDVIGVLVMWHKREKSLEEFWEEEEEELLKEHEHEEEEKRQQMQRMGSARAQVRQTFYETAWDEIKNFASESVFGMLCGAMADFVPEVALPTREKNKSKNRRSVSRSSTRAMSRSGTRAMSRAGTRQQSTRVGSSRGPGRLYSTLSTSQASASAASGSRAPSRSNSDLEKGEGSSAGKTIAESEKSL